MYSNLRLYGPWRCHIWTADNTEILQYNIHTHTHMVAIVMQDSIPIFVRGHED